MTETSNEHVEQPVSSTLPPRIEEQRLLEIATELPGTSIASISTGRGQAAEELRKRDQTPM